MSVSIDILPSSASLDMYGEPDSSSAYSLSGHVSISLTSTTSLFDGRRPVHLLLQSLTVTFEGQSELITPEVGYSPLRLCSISRELIHGEPMELSNEGLEDSHQPCTWNATFDIPVPGWLPATSVFGDMLQQEAGIRYALFATAKYIILDDNSSKLWSYAYLCSPFRRRQKSMIAPLCEITLNRFLVPPTVPSPSTSLFPLVAYSVNASPQESPRSPTHIPLDILNKIKVIASVPECIDVDGSSFGFSLRLRTQDLAAEECKRLQIVDFTANIIQIEKYRYSATSDYRSCFPLPQKDLQPPVKQLISPHSLHTLYELGLVCVPAKSCSATRSLYLTPNGQSGLYALSGDLRIFSSDAEPTDSPTWYTMETHVPYVQCRSDIESNWAGSYKIRPSSDSPQFTVRHELRITLTCKYDIPGTLEQASEKLHFSVPLFFAAMSTSRNVSSPSLIHLSQSSSSLCSTVSLAAEEMLVPSVPYAQSLPAYSQLFEPNGDRKIDYSVQLPIYTPPSTSLHSEVEDESHIKTPTL